MNVLEKLLKADAAKADETQTKVVMSNRLAQCLGEEGPLPVTIRALTAREVQDVNIFSSDEKGANVPSRNLDACLLACEKGIVEPDVRDKALADHYGVRGAGRVVEKIFQMEAVSIATEIMTLSGTDLDLGTEIKN